MKRIKLIIVAILVFVSVFLGETLVVNAQDESFKTTAKSAYLMDFDSGTEIFACNEEKRLPIASMTKIMLLDIVFEKIESGDLSFDDNIIVSEKASGMGGSQVFLQQNKSYEVSDLIKSVIVASANDASVALAEEIAGSEDDFVNIMNKKAKDEGLFNTLFSNCTGLPKPAQYSCAKDVAKMLKSLLRHKDYFKFSNIWLDEITHPDGTKTCLTNTNKLVKFYDGCDGGKTGFTSESLFCLAATANRDGMRLISVVIGEESSNKRFKDVSTMFNKAFSTYQIYNAVDCQKPIDESVFVKGSKEEYFSVYPLNNLTIFTKKNDKFDYSVQTTIFDDLKAPLKKGDKVGEIVLYKDGIEYSRTALTIKCDIKEQTYGEVFKKVVNNW